MTREEAIEIYKGLINPNIIEAFEVLVPELKEIGYDRMRKQIIRGFENWKGNGNLTFNNIRVDDILDWLEKQKELPFAKDVILGYPGVYFYDGERMHFRGSPAMEEKQKEPHYAKRNKLFDKCVENCDPEVMKEVSDNIDKMLEPKIAFGDWGDKEKKEAIITCLQYMRFIKKITNQEYDDLAKWLDSNLVCNLEIPAGDVTPEEDGSFNEDKFLERELSAFLQNYDKEYDDDAAISDVARHFYEIGKKQKEQNPVPISCGHENGSPVDWSKNDTVFLNEIIDFFENKTVKLQHDIDMYAHWLKSIPKRFNLQPKEEWSEEDVEKLAKIRASKSGTLKSEITFYRQGVRDAFNYKGLRPSWKPSEEQIKALEDTLSDMPEHYKPKCTLESLLRDLKKL